MALIRCPECGREVSSLAPNCIHCGFPLDLADWESNNRYALLLLNGGAFHDETAKLLAKRLGIDAPAAMDLTASAPVILERDLSFAEAREAQAACREVCGVKVVLESNASSVNRALNAPEVDFSVFSERERPPAPLGFWGVLGAVCLALVLWSFLSLILFGR